MLARYAFQHSLSVISISMLPQLQTLSTPAVWPYSDLRQPHGATAWRLPSLRQFVTRHSSVQQLSSAACEPTCWRRTGSSSRRLAPPPAASFEEHPQRGSGSSAAHQVQRALGLDYGRRVVGLAVSTLGLAPRPLEGVPGCASVNDQHRTAEAVLEVATREGCDAVVVGLPVTAAGSLRQRASDSQQGRRCRNFALNLAAAAAPRGLRVFLADERGSTMEARSALSASGSRKSTYDKRKDSVAAAVILSTFFDDPSAALLVKPWRPPGAGGAAGGAKQQRLQQQPRQQQQQHKQRQQAAPAEAETSPGRDAGSPGDG